MWSSCPVTLLIFHPKENVALILFLILFQKSKNKHAIMSIFKSLTFQILHLFIEDYKDEHLKVLFDFISPIIDKIHKKTIT